MEVKIKNKELVIRHKLKSNETYRVSKGSKFQSVTIFKKPQIVKGFSNVCEDGKGIIVIDYDNVNLSIVEEDYLYIQKKFKLPPAYLFVTKENNYHVISLYKATQSKIFEILSHTRADENFKTMPLRNPYRSFVLRLSNKKGSKKPKFVKMLGKNEYSGKDISSAHLNLLKKVYPKIKHPLSFGEDGLKELKIHTYETST